MSALEYDPELDDLQYRSVGRLLNAEVFDLSAFERLLAHLDAKAGMLRDEAVVPKQVLRCLRDATEAILSRAEHVPEVRPHRALADRFALLLDLILRGETLADRVPGVPRIR